jgi:glyoxylase-like metal-dependent hydrolase (beta-lactamase superfamily II)
VLLDFPFGQRPPAAGETREVATGVHWLRLPLPFGLDHVNVWLLADGDRWTVVDTGLGNPASEEVWRAVLPNHPLRRLIVTHAHPDHIGMAAWLQQRTGAALSISQGDYQWAQLISAQAGSYTNAAMLELFRLHGLEAGMQAALEQRGNLFRKGVPDLPRTFSRLRDGDDIAIGGQKWRVIAGFGHSPEHCSLYCAGLALLISGDMLLPRISTNVPVMAQMPDDDPLGQFLDSIERFTSLPDDTLVLPAHGFPFRGIRSRVAALQAHHRGRCEAVWTACARAQSVGELIPVVFERPINEPYQAMFAMGEALAHANHLLHQRRLRRIEENGNIRFIQN